MKLETKRLILRKPEKNDVSDLVEGLNNIKISKELAKVPCPYKKKDALWWIKDVAKKSKKKKRESYQFNIELKSREKIIGGAGVFNIDTFDSKAEIGYWLNQNYWRQGIMKEALISLIDFAYKELKLNRLVIKAYSENKASNAIIKKLGFTYEGTERQSSKCVATENVHDVNVYSLLKKEWPKVKRKLK